MIEQALWHGEHGFRVCNESIRLVVLRTGGKLASLIDRTTQREWLAQPAGAKLPAREYGSTFTSAEMCGWDEMAPSVLATSLSDGVVIPDHGEVWAVPWRTVDAGPGSLTQAVTGRSIGFDLVRTITLRSNTISMNYRVLGSPGAPFLWTAHPQFRTAEKSTIRMDACLGEPVVSYGSGTSGATSLHGLPPGHARKTWWPISGHHAAVTLQEPTGDTLTISWNVHELPYLGLWQDNTEMSREPVVSIEPSNGWYDDLRAADHEGRCRYLGPPLMWSLAVTVGDADCHRRS